MVFNLSSSDLATALGGGAALSRTRRARRAQLLAIARELFLSEGYHGTTMERVAASADVSKATLYKYFADKDDLLLALVRERMLAPGADFAHQGQAAFERALAGLTGMTGPDEVEPALLRLLELATIGRSDAFIRLMGELAFDRPLLLTRVRELALNPDTEHFYEAFEPRLSASLPPGLDAAMLMQILYALLAGYRVMNAATLGQGGLTPERWAASIAALLQRCIQPPG